MYAVVCVQMLSSGSGRHKSRSEPVPCISVNQDRFESAKMAVVHLLNPKQDEKVEFECIARFDYDGRTYALIVDNDESTNWVVYTKEILSSDKVTDLRHNYSGTWTRYHLKSSLCKI